MSRFGFQRSPGSVEVVLIEASNPVDMQAKLNAFLAAQTTELVVTNMALSGSGQGANFLFAIEYTAQDSSEDPAPFFNGVRIIPVGEEEDAAVFQVYYGADPAALARARQALVFPADQQLVDEVYAGASDGSQFMGIVLTSPTDAALLNQERPHGMIAATSLSSGSIANGETLIIEGVAGGMNLVIPSGSFSTPTPGVLRYDGLVAGLFRVEGKLTFLLNTPFSGTLGFVKDPTGTPAPFGTDMVTIFAAGVQGMNVVSTIVELEPADEIAMVLNTASTGTAVSASLEAIAL